MILAPAQINRYLRHIIMPEISGPGQKKLLESAVLVCGKTVDDTAVVLHYLAAAGIGRIYCQLDRYDRLEELVADIRDLNADVSIELADGSQRDVQVVLGQPGFICQNQVLLGNSCAPSVIAVYQAWGGGVQVIGDREGVPPFIAALAKVQQAAGAESHAGLLLGERLTTCFLGALCALEAIKQVLGISGMADDFLYLNLLTMNFSKVDKDELAQALPGLYAPKAVHIPQAKLKDSKVLIAGAGGLGCPAAYALALAGVGSLGLVDYDVVEVSNLNRQILHAASRLGMSKSESAAAYLKKLNPELVVNCYCTSLSKENIFDIIAGYDVVIVGVDNFPTRYLLNDACFFAGKTLIDAGVIGFDGTFRTILHGESACYRCTLPDIPASGTVPSCAEAGVLGPVPGIMGFIQAAAVVTCLTGLGNLASDSMLFFDGRCLEFFTMPLKKNDNCPLCSQHPTIKELQEYVFRCAEQEEE